MADWPRRLVGLGVPCLLAWILDTGVTLHGQPPEYWAGDYARTTEGATFGGAMMGWCGWFLLSAWVFLHGYEWCARHIAPPLWYISRRKRLAMRLALQSAVLAGHTVHWGRSRVVRSDRDKCFVLVQNGPPVGRTPESYRMYAVWSATEQVDDLGGWVFHWGVCPAAAIATYEQCRAEGRAWPNGFAEWALLGVAGTGRRRRSSKEDEVSKGA